MSRERAEGYVLNRRNSAQGTLSITDIRLPLALDQIRHRGASLETGMLNLWRVNCL
jgi:hypothetical protein